MGTYVLDLSRAVISIVRRDPCIDQKLLEPTISLMIDVISDAVEQSYKSKRDVWTCLKMISSRLDAESYQMIKNFVDIIHIEIYQLMEVDGLFTPQYDSIKRKEYVQIYWTHGVINKMNWQFALLPRGRIYLDT